MVQVQAQFAGFLLFSGQDFLHSILWLVLAGHCASSFASNYVAPSSGSERHKGGGEGSLSKGRRVSRRETDGKMHQQRASEIPEAPGPNGTQR